MPKRSAQDLIDHYERKIAKLKRKNSVHSDDSLLTVTPLSENSLTMDSYEIAPDFSHEETIPFVQEPEAIGSESHNLASDELGARIDELDARGPDLSEPTILVEPDTAKSDTTVDQIDPELLAALGESTDDAAKYGPNISDRLIKLWQPLLKKGMPHDGKEKLLKEYLIPENCKLLQAPQVNPEIGAALDHIAKLKDKRWVTMQQQLGSAVTAVSRAMDSLMMNGDNRALALKHLSNANRMLCDIHAKYTQIREKIVGFRLDKTTLAVVQDTERDETLLFGEKLAEKIKDAKTLEKQGNQMRKTQTKPTFSQPSTSRQSYSGNWQAPPRYPSARLRGGYKRPLPSSRRQDPTPLMAPPMLPPRREPRPAYQNRPRAPPQ